MKKIYMLFAILFAAFTLSTQAGAQTWPAPEPAGSAFVAGTGYYVYNVGAKSFLDRGGEWSTQAIVASGSLITPVQSSSLWILQYEGATKTLFADNVVDGWTFTDNNKVDQNTWDIQQVDATKNIYSIQINNTYGGYNASQFLGASATVFNSNRGLTYDVRYNRAASDYTNWKFCTAEAFAKFNAQVQLDKYMRIAKLVGSSIDLTSYIAIYNTGTTAEINQAALNLNAALAPADKTSSIANPDFSANTTTGWTMITNNGAASNSEVEYWQKNFDFYQTLTSMPAGIYVVKVQGYERPIDNSSASRTAYINGWDALASRFYATASGVKTFQPMRNVFSETSNTVGANVDGLLFPNSMADAQNSFTAGLYDNELGYVVVDATGTITLGISNVFDNNRAGRWIVFDNFRLYYYGALAIPNITLTQTSLLYTDAITNTKTFNVTGANLTGDITITAPAGITLSGTNLVNNGSGNYTIAQANANSTVTITAIWDESANLSGNITIASAGVTTLNIAVVTSKDKNCFTPQYSSLTNIIADPYCNSLANFGGWGERFIETTNVFCGARSIKIAGRCGGSLDFPLTGKIEGNKTYRVKVMINTNGTGEAKVGISGATEALITNTISTAAGEWLPVDFTFTTQATVTSANMYINSCEAQTATEVFVDNWEMYDITSITTGVSAPKESSLSVYARDNKIVADFHLAQSSEVEFSVYTIQGVLVSAEKASFTAGRNNMTLGANIPSGLYLVKMNSNGKSVTAKVIK